MKVEVVVPEHLADEFRRMVASGGLETLGVREIAEVRPAANEGEPDTFVTGHIITPVSVLMSLRQQVGPVVELPRSHECYREIEELIHRFTEHEGRVAAETTDSLVQELNAICARHHAAFLHPKFALPGKLASVLEDGLPCLRLKPLREYSGLAIDWLYSCDLAKVTKLVRLKLVKINERMEGLDDWSVRTKLAKRWKWWWWWWQKS